MPIYEYECTECGRIAEAWQRFSDRPLTVCQHCSGRLQKLISQSAFHLKGTGWYVTDYADKSSGPSARKAKKPGEKAKKPGEEGKKSDTGPGCSKKEE